MEIEIITKIKSIYSSLTKSEQKVGKFILDNVNKISYMSVTEVAEECGVGEATVLRFCRSMGFTGFQNLKKYIINMAEKKDVPKNVEIKNYIYEEMLTMLNHTVQIQDIENLKNVAKEIMNAKNIFIYGKGLSALSAKASEIRLSFLGYNAYSFDEQHLQLIKANLISKGDIVIGLSVSGATREVIKCLEIAKESGAKIVGITNYNPSPLANISDYIILSASKEVIETGTTLVTLTSQIFIIEQICNELLKIDSTKINLYKNKNFNSYS